MKKLLFVIKKLFARFYLCKSKKITVYRFSVWWCDKCFKSMNAIDT